MEPITPEAADAMFNTLNEICQQYFKTTGKHMLIMYGVENVDDVLIGGAVYSEGMPWDIACKMAVASTGVISANYGTAPGQNELPE